MAKKKGNLFGATVEYTKTVKGTSIGRKPITSTMNKNKLNLPSFCLFSTSISCQ